jgi:hypothetical protein
MDEYLIPQFARVIGQEPLVGGMSQMFVKLKGASPPPLDNKKWAFSDSDSSESSEKDIIERKYETGRGYSLEIDIVPGTNQLSLSGRVHSRANYDGYTFVVKEHTEWIHFEGSQPLSGTVTLNGSGIGVGFQLTPALNYQFGDVQVNTAEVGGFAKVEEAAGWLGKKLKISGKTPAELLRNQQRHDVENLRSWLDGALQNVQISLSQHAFIPPGGGVFTFQNPRFSNAGDLFFDVIYQAP